MAGIVSSGSVLGAAANPSSEFQTLYTIKGSVEAIAAEGSQVAWVRDAKDVKYVEVLHTRRMKRTAIGRVPKGDASDTVISFAFGGSDAQLAVLAGGVCGNTECSFSTWRASTRTGRARQVDGGVTEDYPEFVIAGGGGMLVFPGPRGIRRVVHGRESLVAPASRVTALAAATGRVAVAEDRTRSVDRASPTWSSDGKQMAFARVERDWLDGRYKLDPDDTGIFVARVGRGGRERRVVAGQITSFDWSSDGRFVLNRRASANQIVVTGANGGEERQLTSGTSPRWSPDGTRVAFTRSDAIWVVNADGSDPTRIASGQAAAWSPDSSQLVVAQAGAVSLVDAEGLGPPRVLTDDELGRVRELDWSSDGSRIALSASSSDESDEIEEIAIVNIDGSGRRRLVRADCYDDCGPFTGVRWSSDGKTLLFASRYSSSTSSLYVTSVGTRRTIRRLSSPEPVRTAVSIRRAVGGTLLCRFYLDSQITTLALSPSVVAALVRQGQAYFMSVHDARTGALRRRLRLPRATRLSIVGSRVVFQTGGAIGVLDVRTGRRWRLPAGSVGATFFTIGSRVVWAESDGSGSTTLIRALELP